MTQYDSIAEEYSDPSRFLHVQRKLQIYSCWLHQCGDVMGLNVLDLGCGSGASTRLLAQKGAKVIGVDNSNEMLKIGQEVEDKNPLGITSHFADAGDLPKFPELFDLITPMFLLHYAQSIEELNKFVKGIAKNLKSGGRMAVTNTNFERPVQDFDPELKLSHSAYWEDEPFKNGSRIHITIHGKGGKALASFYNWYFSKEVYEEAFARHGLVDVQWHMPKIDEEGRKITPNWQVIEPMVILMIITARKG